MNNTHVHCTNTCTTHMYTHKHNTIKCTVHVCMQHKYMLIPCVYNIYTQRRDTQCMHNTHHATTYERHMQRGIRGRTESLWLLFVGVDSSMPAYLLPSFGEPWLCCQGALTENPKVPASRS